MITRTKLFSIYYSLYLLAVFTTATAAARVYEIQDLENARQRENDRVMTLPGQPPVKFHHYAGYVKIRPNEEKALFYWFFEAEDDVAHKPLVLWLNGGPGCSSIAFGAAQELGPFLVRDNGTLVHNKFSWNKAANMLFLEAPIGVGFSYTNNSQDLSKLGDKATADDSHAFLINWFKRFPNFKSHEFYITGESYAGHYVPQLGELIYDRNKKSSHDEYINFKGIMIGNAVLNEPTDTFGFIDYAWNHAIISDKLHTDIYKECDLEHNNGTGLCETLMNQLMQAYDNIDMYGIYSPLCLRSDLRYSPKKLAATPRLLSRLELWRSLPSGYDPCTEAYVEKYFNREDVQLALHANVTHLSYNYSSCSDVLGKWTDSAETVLPIIEKLLAASLRIWIFSGDADGRVPVTGTRYSINKMGFKIKREWRAWFDKKQVGGWVETYETNAGDLTLATIHGAGHQVPMYAPSQSLSLFSHFLSAGILPVSRF